MSAIGVPHEAVPGFDAVGVTAFVTTRDAGSFNLGSNEPAADVFGRWQALQEALRHRASRLATAHQVHGDVVLTHEAGWEGWLRVHGADGHFSCVPRTAMAVSLADCVPVFMAHPSGAAAVLHSGWRGTAAGIVRRGVARFEAQGMPARELLVHLGAAICGRCYEVGPEVIRALTGGASGSSSLVDLRAVIAADARAAGVREISVSASCTRCDNRRFYSHRGGDAGRQLAVVVTPSDA